jgi:hypothetical protein
MLASSLWALRAARADATDLLLRDPREPASEWDLNSDLAQAADRLLIELDLAEHTRTREALRRARADARRRRVVGPLALLRHPGREPAGGLTPEGGGAPAEEPAVPVDPGRAQS